MHGKLWRLREAALWNLEPSGHFAGGRYLSFTPPAIPTPYPPARVEPLADCRRRTARGEPPPSQYAGWWNADRLAADAAAAGGSCVSEVRQYKDKGDDGIIIEALRTSPRLQGHMKMAARYLLALRDGMAVAWLLNRTFVFPHFESLCDRSEWPDIMPTCRLENSDLAFPFRSPLNFLINVHFMQGIEGGDGSAAASRTARTFLATAASRRRCATRVPSCASPTTSGDAAPPPPARWRGPCRRRPGCGAAARRDRPRGAARARAGTRHHRTAVPTWRTRRTCSAASRTRRTAPSSEASSTRRCSTGAGAARGPASTTPGRLPCEPAAEAAGGRGGDESAGGHEEVIGLSDLYRKRAGYAA